MDDEAIVAFEFAGEAQPRAAVAGAQIDYLGWLDRRVRCKAAVKARQNRSIRIARTARAPGVHR